MPVAGPGHHPAAWEHLRWAKLLEQEPAQESRELTGQQVPLRFRQATAPARGLAPVPQLEQASRDLAGTTERATPRQPFWIPAWPSTSCWGQPVRLAALVLASQQELPPALPLEPEWLELLQESRPVGSPVRQLVGPPALLQVGQLVGLVSPVRPEPLASLVKPES